MSDSDSQPDDPIIPRTRKRGHDPDSWAQNVAKRRRNSGKDYVSRATGRHINARAVGPPCRDGCFTKITMPIIQSIHDDFWNIGDFAMQNAYIQKCVQAKEVKRRRNVQNPEAARRRGVTKVYTLSYSNIAHVVCLKGFTSALAISETRVRNALKAVSASACPRGDLRGRHPCPHRIPEDQVNKVLEHMHSFPTVSSHYTRAKSPNMRYLEGNLNVKKMFRLYLIWMEDNYPDEQRVKLSFYRKKFRCQRLGFKPPMTDTCSKCDSLKVAMRSATPETLPGLTEKKKEHIKQAKDGQALMKRLGRTADDQTKTLCLDLQQTLPLPRLSTSVAYYQKKLWMYNLCIHDLKKRRSEFFVWDEVEGGRGSSDIASCLLKWLSDQWASGEVFTKLKIVSDNCGGQNKNINIVLMYLREVHSGRLTEIEHYYLIPGHSYMACDRAFGNIEKSIRAHVDIFDFKGYCTAIRASTVRPQKVTVMRQADFVNLDVLQKFITLRRPKAPYSFQDARCLKVNAKFKSGYFLSMGYDTPLGSVRLQKGQSVNPRNFNLANVNLPPKYPGPRPLKEGKVKALKYLLGYVPPARDRYLKYIISTQENLEDDGSENEEDVDNDLNDNLDYDEEDGGPPVASTSSQ